MLKQISKVEKDLKFLSKTDAAEKEGIEDLERALKKLQVRKQDENIDPQRIPRAEQAVRSLNKEIAGVCPLC